MPATASGRGGGALDRREQRDGREAAGEAPAIETVAGINPGGGAPLPDGVRERFESSLGADLSAVRVHTDGEASAAAESLHAQAFTLGNDIHFAAGRFQPDNPFGLRLLGHEVAHTRQQAGGSAEVQRKGELEVSRPDDPAEHEADRAADAMMRGEPASVSSAGLAVQRWFGSGESADGNAAASAPAPKAPSYLVSYLLNQPFPWEAEPSTKAPAIGLIRRWIDFYGLSVHGTPDLDQPDRCAFNGDFTYTVSRVVTHFMQDSKAAGYKYDISTVHEVISQDQKVKRERAAQKWQEDVHKDHGRGRPADGGGGEHTTGKKKHDTRIEIEWEFTPTVAKKTWGGGVEAEPPKGALKGVLGAKVREIGAWKAELSGGIVVELNGNQPIKIGPEFEGKLSSEFLHGLAELEIVGKVLVANEIELREGHPAGDRLHSGSLHVEPTAEANVVYTIPGTGKRLKVKGGISADPEGVSAGAAFSVTWKW